MVVVEEEEEEEEDEEEGDFPNLRKEGWFEKFIEG